MIGKQRIFRLIGTAMLLWIPFGGAVVVGAVHLLTHAPVVFWSIVGGVLWTGVALFCLHKGE